jgi:clan AA aspartic protease (TIGR02281 family)
MPLKGKDASSRVSRISWVRTGCEFESENLAYSSMCYNGSTLFRLDHCVTYPMNRFPFHNLCPGLLIAILFAIGGITGLSHAQDLPKTAKYSDEIVSKADKIFADAGLRRSGKTISTTSTADVARGISALSRSRRSLKLIHDTWKQTSQQLAQMKRQSELLNVQNIELNTQLAKPFLDATTNNRLVGLINANVAKMRQLETEEGRFKEKLSADRKAVNDAEAAYAESVLALRRDLNAVKVKLDETLKSEELKIAVKVSNANFGTPATLTTDTLLTAIDKRLKQIEQEIFSESVPLDVTENGSLYVNVSVGDQSIRMVLDSGATLISLPAATASQLGIIIPADAPQLRLVLADGREIPGRAVTIAKVRIGQFEAEDVEAAVLDAVATNAEPLLGMSFLGNFKFEIDTADKSLKLLRVNDE